MLIQKLRQTRSVTERSTIRSQRLMLCIIGRHVPPLSQNKQLIIVYFGYPMESVEGRSGFAFGLTDSSALRTAPLT
jgi:hypothetical protein